MRRSPRDLWIRKDQVDLSMKISWYCSSHDLDDVETLRLITGDMREILLDMEPKVERAERFSAFYDMVRGYQLATGLTDIEVLQTLFTYCQEVSGFMLRYERHGDYDTPAGVEKE